MDIEYEKDIEFRTNKKIKEIIPMYSDNKFKKYYRIIMSDGKKYLLKQVALDEERILRYLFFQKLQIQSFQKTEYCWKNKKGKYMVLAEWIDGDTLGSGLWNNNYKFYLSYLKFAAEKVREIHLRYQIGKKSKITINQVAKILDVDYISQEHRSLLERYILKNLEMVNSRYLTVIHGDFHLKNIVKTKNGILFVDLDDVMYGDAYMDLVYAANIHYTYKENVQYYMLLQYYFDKKTPSDFWPIVNVYSIFKALIIMRCEVENSDSQKPTFSMEGFIEEHNFMNDDIPRWYKEIENKIEKMKAD